MGVLGSIINDVFISSVTAPAASAAGRDDGPKGEAPAPGEEINVFTVFTSVFMGNVWMLWI